MEALLWHRLTMQKWYVLLIFVVCIVLTVVDFRYLSGDSGSMFPLIFSATIVESMYTQDEKVKWELFVNSLPLTKKSQLQADFLYCYALIALLFIFTAPIYFSQPYEDIHFTEHFALYFAKISSAIMLICTQFYIHHLEETKGMRTLRMGVGIVLIFAINFSIHYYLSMVAANLAVILIPTIISLIISIYVFRKCHALYVAKEIF